MVIRNVAKCAKKQSVVIIVWTNHLFGKKSSCDKKSYLGRKRGSREHFSALASKNSPLMPFFYRGNFFLHTWTIFPHDLSGQLWQQKYYCQTFNFFFQSNFFLLKISKPNSSFSLIFKYFLEPCNLSVKDGIHALMYFQNNIP